MMSEPTRITLQMVHFKDGDTNFFSSDGRMPLFIHAINDVFRMGPLFETRQGLIFITCSVETRSRTRISLFDRKAAQSCPPSDVRSHQLL